MSYGIQIQNGAGALIIDSDYQNHRVAASGSGTTASLGGFVIDSKVFKVTLGAAIPMTQCPLVWARIGVNNAGCGLVGLEVNAGGSLTGFWIGSDNFFGGGASRTVEWRVTATATAGSGAAHGIQVFNASGDWVWDSGHEYLEIVHVSSPFSITDTGSTLTHSSIANPWYCLSALAYLMTSSPSGDDTVWQCGMARRTSATQTFVNVEHYAYLAGDSFYSSIGGGAQQRQLVLAQ